LASKDYWRDKVAVVTGGSQGLGWEIARALADRGAHLVLAALPDPQLERSVQTLQASGCEALGVPTDITQQASVDSLVTQVQERFGRVDVLVNCAGRSARGAILETTPDDFLQLLQLNFLAMTRCTVGFGAALVESKGHIINIGSLAAKSASSFLGAYPASKFPVAAYSQQLRLELNPLGVHVLLVCPGPLAREDAGSRYDDQAAGLPEAARKPGGGVRVKGIPPEQLVARILRSCERRKPELVMPAKAKLLFAIAQLSPSLGDWILKKMT
jgi:short-subunit dehydrogenase